jgi:hypothetical protein
VQAVATSNVDLAASAVSGPATGLEGQSVTVSWTVSSVGAGTATGSWHDAVYLSASPVLTPDAILLGEVQHTGDLGPGQGCSASGTFTLPGVAPGNYYFLVRTNSRNEVFEGTNLSNNVAASAPVAMDLPALTLGTPLTGTLPATGAAELYKVTTAAGSDLNVALTGPDGNANELYVSFGDVPTRQSFDARGVRAGSANQSVSVPSTLAGTYYVLVYGANVPSAESFTVTASTAGFSITGVSPTQGSNAGQVTLAISGAQFDANSRPRLIDSAGGTINPTGVYLTDSGSLAATFDLTGHPAGSADVQVMNGGGTVVTLPAGFRIVVGKAGRLVTSVSAPGAVRLGRGYVVSIDYANEGDADLVAPILRLTSTGLSQLSLSPDLSDASAGIDLVAVSPTGPAGVLPPGAHNRITVYASAAATGQESLQLAVGEYDDGPTIDYASLEPTLRPADMSDADWAAIFPQIRRALGSTWDDYQRAISAATTLLTPADGLNYSLDDVYALIVNDALAHVGPSVSGKLFLGDAGHPLTGVEIRLDDPVGDQSYEGVARTDGSFVIPQVAPGTYDLTVDGFTLTGTSQVTVGTGGVTGLVLTAAAAATISGSVVDGGTGVPLRDVLVVASAADGTTFSAVSDGDGRYTIDSLPPGTYEVRSGGAQYVRVAVPGLSLGAGQVLTHVNLVLQQGGTISGHVTGAGGPAAGATVTAYGPGNDVTTATTDAAGAYSLPGLAAGTYTLAASAPGFFSQQTTGVGLVAGTTLSGLDLTLLAAGGLAGQTTAAADGTPVPFVMLRLSNGQRVYSLQSDDSGHFAAADLPPGDYTLTSANFTRMTSQAHVTVVAGAVQSVTLPVAPTGKVTGTVRDAATGHPLALAALYVAGPQGTAAATVTDAQGRYAIDGLDAGTYTVVLGDAGTPGVARTQVTLDLSHTNVTADLSVAVAGFVSGTLLRADGVTPVSGQVTLSAGGHSVLSLPTDAQGHYGIFVLTAGDYEVEAGVPNLAFPLRTVTVTTGSLLTGQDFIAGSTALGGTVQDAGGNLLAGVSVAIAQTHAGDPQLLTTLTTGADGQFSFAGAVPGSYVITAHLDGYGTVTASATVSVTGAPTLNLTLGAAGTLGGTLRDALSGAPLAGAALTLSLDADPRFRATATSDAAGLYTFVGLAAGGYTLAVAAAGHETALIPHLNIGPGSRLLDVGLSRAGISVRGTVRGAVGPLPAATVTATDPTGLVVAQAQTAADGTYTLGTLPPGSYSVVARGAGYGTSAPRTLTVAEGDSLANVDLALTAVALSDAVGWPTQTESDFDPGSWFNYLPTGEPAKPQFPTRDEVIHKISTAKNGFAILTHCKDQLYALLNVIGVVDGYKTAEGSYERLVDAFNAMAKVKGGFTDLTQALASAYGNLSRMAGRFSQAFADLKALSIPILSTLNDDAMKQAGFPPSSGSEEDRVTDLVNTIAQELAQLRKKLAEGPQDDGSGNSTFSGLAELQTKLREHVKLMQAILERWGAGNTNSQSQFGVSSASDSLTRFIQGTGELNANIAFGSILDALNAKDPNIFADAVARYDAARKELDQDMAFLAKARRALNACIKKLKTKPAKPPANCGTSGGTNTPNVTTNLDTSAIFAPAASLGSPVLSAASSLLSGSTFELPPSPFFFPTLRPSCQRPVSDTSGPAIKTAVDPNDLTGPVGSGPQGFIQPATLPYEVEFENDPRHATAAAQVVTATLTLDSNLDPGTFQFTGFGFGSHTFSVPAGLTHYETIINLRPDGTNLLVPVTLDLNPATGVVTVTFQSLDPLTRLAPDGINDGFLPVDNANHDGEGFFTYTVSPRPGLPTGTAIRAQASIVFDTNDPLKTPAALNTLDVGDPTSSVAALAAVQYAPDFPVSWSGSDDAGGSGVAFYDVEVSDNGGPFTGWLEGTTQTSATFTGEDLHTYTFRSIAHDNVGHAQAAPTVLRTTKVDLTADHLTISAPSQVIGGGRWTATVNAVDPAGVTDPLYDGTVTLLLSGGPPGGKLTRTTTAAFQDGVAVLGGVSLNRAGGYTLYAASNGALVGAGAAVTVAPTTQFAVKGAPSRGMPGQSFTFTVRALDATGRLDTSYLGTVRLTSSDPQVAPFTYQFQPGDMGSRGLTVTLLTPGRQTVTVADITAPGAQGTSNAVTVSGTVPLAIDHFTITGLPATIVTGTTHNVTITAVNIVGKVVPNYTGTVQITSSDGAFAPLTVHFTTTSKGLVRTPVTLSSLGMQSLTATGGGKSGTASNIDVVSPATQLGVSASATKVTAGVQVLVTVRGLATPKQTDMLFADTLQLVTSDPAAVVVAQPMAGGVETFAVTFETAGTQTITVTDLTRPTIQGPALSVTVTCAAAAQLNMTGLPLFAVAGATERIRVTAEDAYGNRVLSGFTDTVTLAGQTYVFKPGNQGTHSFTTVLGAAGSESLTATDTTNPNVRAGSQAVTVVSAPTALTADPADGAETALVVIVPAGGGTVVIAPADAAGTSLSVTVNGKAAPGSPFAPTGHVIVYGQGGAVLVKEVTAMIGGQTATVAVPAVLLGGSGTNTLSVAGSSADNVLVGGAGKNSLTGGGGRDVLIGGGGASALHAGTGGDILLGGGTIYDTDVTALLLVLAEWGRHDRGYPGRVQDLFGASSRAVPRGTAVDQLFGGAGEDWFWLKTTDKIGKVDDGEIVTLL